MYKLVVIGGKLRGQEFILENGENTVGRTDECNIELNVNGVSKKHLSLTVTDDVVYAKDLGSSNGTFVNGKIIKGATLKNGDKITLPDIILQLVFVKEKKIIVKRQAEEDPEEVFFKGGEAPNHIPGKIVHLFKYKLMPILHGINEEYEWKILFGILLVVFVVITNTLTIFPVLQDSKKILLHETAKRGEHYAEEISRINARALEQKRLDQVDTGFLDSEDGVVSYELFDLEGRIVRPLTKLNEYIDDTFSVSTREWAVSENTSGDQVVKQLLGDGEIGIGKKIIAYNARLGTTEAVGVIAIRFAPKSLAIEATQSSKAYFEALVTAFIVSIMFFGIIYFLTIRPLEEVNFQIEEALRGKKKSIESRYLMNELKPLKNSINTLLQRVRELSNTEEDGMDELEDDTSYVNMLKEFIKGASGPTIVLSSEKNLVSINIDAEDITGIRESAAEGMNILDVSREKGFAATLLELCDESANNAGECAQGEYELQGRQYNVFVNTLMGKDNFAKSFYITFREEE